MSTLFIYSRATVPALGWALALWSSTRAVCSNIEPTLDDERSPDVPQGGPHDLQIGSVPDPGHGLLNLVLPVGEHRTRGRHQSAFRGRLAQFDGGPHPRFRKIDRPQG